MKYLGEQSLSSLLSTLLGVAWYLIIVFAFSLIVAALFLLAFKLFLDPVAMGLDGKYWQAFLSYPVWALTLMALYTGVSSALILQIIKHSKILFSNFENNIVFEQGNVVTIKKISKFMICIAIINISLGALFVSALLFILCEIFKNGTLLQEEQNFTI